MRSTGRLAAAAGIASVATLVSRSASATNFDPDPEVIGIGRADTNVFYFDDNGSLRTIYYGKPGDEQLLGDWDGDGIDTIGIRRGTDEVHLRNSNTSGPGSVRTINDVRPDDVLLVGDLVDPVPLV